MKKVLLIGAAGFVGSYLCRYFQQNTEMEVILTKLEGEHLNGLSERVYDLNILEEDSILDLLERVKPDFICHLAAQSSVALSWKKPALTIDINIKGSVNLLEAIVKSTINPRVLLIGSGEEYGHINSNEVPINENNLLRPGNIYAATKACQNMLGKIYSDAYNIDIMSVRAFNHIGPNQSERFVVADFCKQVADIEKGKQSPVLKVGNLSAKRDFTDVRDVVRGYAMLLDKGVRGETYNMGSGHAVEIRDILEKIISLSTRDIRIEVDKNKLRPVDIPIIEADTSKIYECCGWKPEISLEQTIQETLDYWRK